MFAITEAKLFQADGAKLSSPPAVNLPNHLDLEIEPVRINREDIISNAGELPFTPIIKDTNILVSPSTALGPVEKVVNNSLTAEVGGNPLDFVQKVVAGLASLPATAAGGAVGGYKGGLMRTVEEIELGLTQTRGKGELLRTVYEWANILVNADAALELIGQLKKYGVFEEGTSPQEAVAVAARFMNAVLSLREQETAGEKILAKAEQEVLAIELKSMVMQTEAAGALALAPLAGGVTEIFGRLPVLLANELGPGIMEALKNTLAVGAKIPGEVAAAFVVGPYKGIADGIREVTDATTPGVAVGLLVFALFPTIVSGLIITGKLIPDAAYGDKAGVIAFAAAIGMMMGIPAGTFVELINRWRNKVPHGPTQPSGAPEKQFNTAEPAQVIEASFSDTKN